ncbi:hypothetical protein ABVT39_005731 [Epinephelus coioides]
MMKCTLITALIICSLGWISVSAADSQTVEVQSGSDEPHDDVDRKPKKSDDVTKLMSVILGGLTAVLLTVIIGLVVTIRKLQKGWISVSAADSQTVEVQSGKEVSLTCSKKTDTPTVWFRVVNRTKASWISTMMSSSNAPSYCDECQSGKFKMSSNNSTASLKMKTVAVSDSGLYFCVVYSRGQTFFTTIHLNVEESDDVTKLMSVILGGLTAVLLTVIIGLVVTIRKLQKGWISVSAADSQTVEVQSGKEVSLTCSTKTDSPTVWFRVVNRTKASWISTMMSSSNDTSYCDGCQSGKFEMSSDTLKMKTVAVSDSGLYYCVVYSRGQTFFTTIHLNVEESDDVTKLMSVILGGLTVVQLTVIIGLVVTIRKLQKGWISVSAADSQTVEVQSGKEVSLTCSKKTDTPTVWFRVVNRTKASWISTMMSSSNAPSYCDECQSGKFKMSSNNSTASLKMKTVAVSDSGLYFCVVYSRGQTFFTTIHLNVEESDDVTKLMSVILGGLTAVLLTVIIGLVVTIRKLQKGWISVSAADSQTVEVQSGKEVSLTCSKKTDSPTVWFRVVNRTKASWISTMMSSSNAPSYCDGCQSGKFEMSSDTLKMKTVAVSDSGLYYCVVYSSGETIFTTIHLNVEDSESDDVTKLMSVILGGLTAVLLTVIIGLVVKIRKLQKAASEEQNPPQHENPGSDDLNYAAVNFCQKGRRREVEQNVVYSSTR